jgi:prephenate dehydrogenase
VIGLERTGASIGLALADKGEAVHCEGYDPSPYIRKQVKKQGGFKKVVKNLKDALSQTDIVILAVPVDEIRAVLEQLAPLLKPDTVVVDTSPLQIAVAAWARELLPKEVDFIAMTSMFNPAYLNEIAISYEDAHADLFQNSLMVITNTANAHSENLNLVAGLVEMLGGTPYFADPYEVDGLLSATRFLPQLTAAAVAMANINQPGWREGKKIAGSAFACVTAPLEALDERSELGLSAIHNRENMLRVIDNVISALMQLRSSIEAQDGAALKELLIGVKEERTFWISQRREGKWE